VKGSSRGAPLPASSSRSSTPRHELTCSTRTTTWWSPRMASLYPFFAPSQTLAQCPMPIGWKLFREAQGPFSSQAFLTRSTNCVLAHTKLMLSSGVIRSRAERQNMHRGKQPFQQIAGTCFRSEANPNALKTFDSCTLRVQSGPNGDPVHFNE
jgi:hypothetical protein